MKIAVVGAEGFVGSAFHRQLGLRGHQAEGVTRKNFLEKAGQTWDLVVDAAGNSRKYLAEQEPWKEFELSVGHKKAVLQAYPAKTHLHISSVDVYRELSLEKETRENSAVGQGASVYGFHKWLAEELVRFHARSWLMVRLAGMVGPGLKKNPVFDVMTGQKVRIHPDSEYQFLSTDEAARLSLDLWAQGVVGEIYNVCGEGTITPREIAKLAGKKLETSGEGEEPRKVRVNLEKLKKRTPIPQTKETITAFLAHSPSLK